MKKAVIFAVIIATVAMGAGALEWHGDVQAQVGWQRSDTVTRRHGGILGVSESTFVNDSLYAAVQTWQFPLTFHASNWAVSVGFFGKVDAAFSPYAWGGDYVSVYGGRTVHRDFDVASLAFALTVGPAAEFNLNGKAALRVGAGFLGGFERVYEKASDHSAFCQNGVVGVAVDAQIKLFPAKTFSPVLGFQYAYRGMDKYFFQWRDPWSEDAEWRDYKFDAHTYAVYGGVSWNF